MAVRNLKAEYHPVISAPVPSAAARKREASRIPAIKLLRIMGRTPSTTASSAAKIEPGRLSRPSLLSVGSLPIKYHQAVPTMPYAITGGNSFGKKYVTTATGTSITPTRNHFQLPSVPLENNSVDAQSIRWIAGRATGSASIKFQSRLGRVISVDRNPHLAQVQAIHGWVAHSSLVLA